MRFERFSFFYTSLAAMRRLSGNEDGFGGDLRFGMPTGLEGADRICQTIARDEGFGAKTWRAFLSATRGVDGRGVHAIFRVGSGPWYDRLGRLIAMNPGGLIAARPVGDPAAVNDLPDETGRGTSWLGTSDGALTGSTALGLLESDDPGNTCADWTDAASDRGVIRTGHASLATEAGGEIESWIAAHIERSCRPGVNLVSNGFSDGSSIGAAGGYGGFYCFALSP